jgi:hypothetical protein
MYNTFLESRCSETEVSVMLVFVMEIWVHRQVLMQVEMKERVMEVSSVEMKERVMEVPSVEMKERVMEVPSVEKFANLD